MTPAILNFCFPEQHTLYWRVTRCQAESIITMAQQLHTIWLSRLGSDMQHPSIVTLCITNSNTRRMPERLGEDVGTDSI